MEDDSETLAVQYRALSILQLAFASGQIIFALIVFNLVRSDPHSPNWSDPLTMVAIALTFVFVPLSLFLHKSGVTKAQAETDLDNKIAIYRMTFIRRTAFLEGCSLFSIILVLLTHCLVYYVFTAISFGTFLFLWVTLSKMRSDLNI